MRKKNYLNFIAIGWKWSSECFKSNCRQIFWRYFFAKKKIENDPVSVLKAIVGRFSGDIFLRKKNYLNFIAIGWKWSSECFKSNCRQIFWRYFFAKKNYLNFIAIGWKWSSECFKSNCRQIFWRYFFAKKKLSEFHCHRLKMIQWVF